MQRLQLLELGDWLGDCLKIPLAIQMLTFQAIARIVIDGH